MKFTDWLLVAANLIALMLAIVGLVAQHPDPMSFALVWALGTALLNGAVVLRRGGSPNPRPAALDAEALPAPTELEAYRVLDIDQRLEALERSESRRVQALADEGVLTGPAAPSGGSVNGRGRRERA